MTMMLGASKGPTAELNVTPMIDILLVMIVIFMLLPHHLTGEKADIPQPANQRLATLQPEGTVVLQLHGVTGEQKPALLLNREPVTWEELQQRLRQIYAFRKENVLFVKADEVLPFDPVAQVIDMAHAAVPGLTIGLLTTRIDAGER